MEKCFQNEGEKDGSFFSSNDVTRMVAMPTQRHSDWSTWPRSKKRDHQMKRIPIKPKILFTSQSGVLQASLGFHVSKSTRKKLLHCRVATKKFCPNGRETKAGNFVQHRHPITSHKLETREKYFGPSRNINQKRQYKQGVLLRVNNTELKQSNGEGREGGSYYYVGYFSPLAEDVMWERAIMTKFTQSNGSWSEIGVEEQQASQESVTQVPSIGHILLRTRLHCNGQVSRQIAC